MHNNNNNNPRIRITIEEATQPETRHFTGVALNLASSPGPKRGPGTHCLRMRQSVLKILVHRIFP